MTKSGVMLPIGSEGSTWLYEGRRQRDRRATGLSFFLMMYTMAENKRWIEVVGGILWRGDAFLAAQRPEGHPQAGFWEFPGGKVEPGETLEAALSRELAEELSLSVRHPHFWRTVEHDYGFRAVRLHFFHITEFSGEPAANDGQDFRWVTPEEAHTLPFLEADRPLLDELQRP